VHENNLNIGSQQFDKVHQEYKYHDYGFVFECISLSYGFGRYCSLIEEYVILWFSNFIKINFPSALNRNGKISKLGLYHTSQQLSQHDYSIRIFSHNTCMRNKLHASFYLKNVMNMSLFRFLNEVWFKICRESWLVHLSLILVITIFVYLNSKL
jgi:hypothetical protein